MRRPTTSTGVVAMTPRSDPPSRDELERGFDELGAGASAPSWGEVRARLRARSALKGRGRPGGARRAGPSDRQEAPVHDDRQGTMKESSRRGPSRGSSDRRPSRPRDDADEPRRTSAPRVAGADELLELADELQDQARALMQQARRLQRMAESMDRSESARPARPPRTGPKPGGARGGPRREGGRPEGAEGRPRKRAGEERPRREGGDEPRPRKRPGGAPEWAPKGGKKRRPS
jgi:hypothetical protein